MAMSWNKKERENKKREQKKKKEERKQERKDNTSKGKGLDDMMAYIDENGNISSVPPDPSKRVAIDVESINIGVANSADANAEDEVNKGTISFFNDEKGFGFIEDRKTRYRLFVHQSSSKVPLKEGMEVSYDIEKGTRGLTAVNVTLA